MRAGRPPQVRWTDRHASDLIAGSPWDKVNDGGLRSGEQSGRRIPRDEKPRGASFGGRPQQPCVADATIGFSFIDPLPEQVGAPDPQRLDQQQGLHVREPARIGQRGKLGQRHLDHRDALALPGQTASFGLAVSGPIRGEE